VAVLIFIDPNHGVPAYRQIVDQLRFQIASGRLAPGSELPSTRALAQQLGINPMTVSKAYGLLEEEGLLRHRPGLPLEVAAQTRRQVDTAREDRLRAALEPAALAARQLGLSKTHALAVFRELLSELITLEEADHE
jgi:GntR family transcriptional regulator